MYLKDKWKNFMKNLFDHLFHNIGIVNNINVAKDMQKLTSEHFCIFSCLDEQLFWSLNSTNHRAVDSSRQSSFLKERYEMSWMFEKCLKINCKKVTKDMTNSISSNHSLLWLERCCNESLFCVNFTSNGFAVLITTLRILRGAQETKNTEEITVKIILVLLLLLIFLYIFKYKRL